jgi:nucleotide-binding universal stress UspA family protein
MSTEPVKIAEPLLITQGEDIDWKQSFLDYPASEWTLQYRFRGPGTGFNVTATADGGDFAVSVTSEQTEAMAVGKYLWQAWATNISDSTITRKVADGSVTVERGFSESSPGMVELRTIAKQNVDAIDATLLVMGSSKISSYEMTTPVGSKKVVYGSRSELLEQRKYYAKIVARENARERIEETGKFGQTMGLRFHES